MLYIAAVTKLSEGEESASEGLGNRRYLLGLAAFAPLAAMVPVLACRMNLPDPRIAYSLLLLPVLVFLYVRLRQQVCKNRTRRMLQGNGRDAVLYGYGELLRLIRHGASESDDAQALADEAAFSDHLLGEAQKRAMAGYVKAARKELEGTLPRHRLWYLRYLLWLW